MQMFALDELFEEVADLQVEYLIDHFRNQYDDDSDDGSDDDSDTHSGDDLETYDGHVMAEAWDIGWEDYT
jgi:hypothetical protein